MNNLLNSHHYIIDISRIQIKPTKAWVFKKKKKKKRHFWDRAQSLYVVLINQYPGKVAQILEEGRRLCLRSLSCCCFLYFSFYFSGCPKAYGVSRPGIRSELQLQPKPQLRRCQILNPLCQAGDQTCVPGLPRYFPSCCTTEGTPIIMF